MALLECLIGNLIFVKFCSGFMYENLKRITYFLFVDVKINRYVLI